MKIQYRNYEGGGEENRGQKNQTNDVFDFFDAIFVTHRRSCADCSGEVRWGGGSVWVVG